ncbi:MAG: ribosome biogenesis GTPase Der [Phycisphaerae bacterium]|nr:ribosome biogenesis GTPase Der [Phycisphaerae bacterium]MDD5380505.1 ribosome biogenesis GTPase Der [Phycisphaerae bacterium]
MALPVVAIIGRPNVGKSSLFNALAGEMISIVEPTAGVTRDRVSAIVKKGEKYFELIDTGGYGIVDAQQLSEHIEQQIVTAIESADIVLFTVDIREGIVPLDERISQLLRREGLAVIGVANKADDAKMFPTAGEFSRLGFGEFICVSATNNLNKQVLLERIFEKIEHLETKRPAAPVMKIAIVGKQNVGKSTMVNAMVGSERVIVSKTPGTTRDAIDVRFEKDGKTIVVIDTAGIRKKSRMADIEFYSFVRATRSIQRADVVLFLIDATADVSDVDKRIARFIADEYKSCIIVINKWDLATKTTVTGSYEDYLTKLLPGLKYAPIAFTTATEAKNVQSVLDLATEIFSQTTTWITTGRLNKAFEAIKAESMSGGKHGGGGRPNIFYATQVAVNPVTILMFVNKTELFDENHRRFIIGRLRELLPTSEVPIKLLARARRREKET